MMPSGKGKGYAIAEGREGDAIGRNALRQLITKGTELTAREKRVL